MLKPDLRRYTAFLFALALLTCNSYAAEAEQPSAAGHPLWRVDSGIRSLYLLGSIHFLNKGYKVQQL